MENNTNNQNIINQFANKEQYELMVKLVNGEIDLEDYSIPYNLIYKSIFNIKENDLSNILIKTDNK